MRNRQHNVHRVKERSLISNWKGKEQNRTGMGTGNGSGSNTILTPSHNISAVLAAIG